MSQLQHMNTCLSIQACASINSGKSALCVGTFDIKASRIQECGSVDMSKYGHSQTAKIKSKHCFGLFFLLLLLWIANRLQGIDKTVGTIQMCANIYPSSLLFHYFLEFSLCRCFSNAAPTPFCSEALCHMKKKLFKA